MNFIIWLVVGGLIGWVASMIMRTDGQQGIFLNIIVGIVGAMLGGWLISPLVGVPTINQGSLSIGHWSFRYWAPSFCWRSSISFAAVLRAKSV